MTNDRINHLDERRSTERIISERDLEILLKECFRKLSVPSEYWWKNTNKWFKIKFNHLNSLTYGNVNPELRLIWNNESELSGYMEEKTLIFYGLGAGETEGALIDIALKEKTRTEVITVDINEEFIYLFEGSLYMLSIEKENSIIFSKGYIGRFQDLEKKHLELDGLSYETKNHIVLGNTVANIGEELISIISRLSSEGDYMTLGFSTPEHIRTVFNKIIKNVYFTDFVMSHMPDGYPNKLKWSIEDGSTITAQYESVEMFRSKLYKPDELDVIGKKYEFIPVFTVLDDNKHSCIKVYRKEITD